MTTQERQSIKVLIPDLLPLNHVSLNLKRIRFIQGQGVVLYDDIYAVEIYIPKGDEGAVFFGVHKHRGKIQELKNYFKKPRVLHCDDPYTTTAMKDQFNEAIFQYQPVDFNANSWIRPSFDRQIETKEIYLHSNLSGAA